MVIILDEEQIEMMLKRLRRAGLPVSVAANLLGLSRIQAYQRVDGDVARMQCQPKVDMNMLNKAEELVEKGYPIDLVCRLSGISATKLVYFLDDSIEA